MQGKFGRTYRLDVFTPAGKQITIEPPLTLRFGLTRNTLASANTASLEIINLGPQTRNQIYKDRFSIPNYWQVKLQAGYNNRLHQIFTGNIFEAYSVKEKTEWKTILDCYDGLYAIQNGFTSMTVEKNTPKQNYIKQIINNLPGLVAGAMGSPSQGQSPRGKALVGQSYDLLNQETEGNVISTTRLFMFLLIMKFYREMLSGLTEMICCQLPGVEKLFLMCKCFSNHKSRLVKYTRLKV